MMISNRQPEVYVHYNTKLGRVAKHFTDVYAARRFYVKQDSLDNNPSVSRSNIMSDTATTTATATKKTPVLKKKNAKKAPAKKAEKAPAKTTKSLAKKAPAKTTKAPAKKAESPVAKKASGLRKPQLRILEWMAKQKLPKTRNEIAEGAGVDPTMMTSYLGSVHEEKRLANDAKKYLSLLSAKLIKFVAPESEDSKSLVYTITPKGLESLE